MLLPPLDDQVFAAVEQRQKAFGVEPTEVAV